VFWHYLYLAFHFVRCQLFVVSCLTRQAIVGRPARHYETSTTDDEPLTTNQSRITHYRVTRPVCPAVPPRRDSRNRSPRVGSGAFRPVLGHLAPKPKRRPGKGPVFSCPAERYPRPEPRPHSSTERV